MIQEWQSPENDGHNVKLITKKSLRFMENNQDAPFFLYISHNTIHEPLVERKATIEKYRNKPGADLEKNNPIIAAMVERLDKNVGRLMAKLDELIKCRTLRYERPRGGCFLFHQKTFLICAK